MKDVWEAVDKYNERFEDGFPVIPLLEERTDSWVMSVCEKCLAADKDIYEMGFYDAPDDGLLI